MTGPLDVAIIGGGHNALVAAAYLARAGLSVQVLEARHVVGGAAVTEEFHPGYRNSVCSYLVGLLSPRVVARRAAAAGSSPERAGGCSRPAAGYLVLSRQRVKVKRQLIRSVVTRSRCCHNGPRIPYRLSNAKVLGSKRIPSLGTDQRGCSTARLASRA